MGKKFFSRLILLSLGGYILYWLGVSGHHLLNGTGITSLASRVLVQSIGNIFFMVEIVVGMLLLLGLIYGVIRQVFAWALDQKL